ncbi:glutathione S-transferase C-terminal domain-containing protein homolog [Orussus abietinus]|uniref:glutathione S-transferase C-terminal domain-containing protein homolog n=1 Tax=Orussus abietinus TaxID=222816 RepID=UPI0006257939|nr:glutathione S-transferase C-terminal domain-containing protein homolog [Orussus abietinus]
MTVAGIYLKIFSLTDICKAPIETIIALFTIKYCDSTVNIKLIECEQKLGECGYTVDLSSFVYKILSKEKVPDCANSCELPNILVNERSCIAGLCACLRQIVKSAIDVVPSHHCQTLLGFKNSCLLACSEVSVWTRFCEVDLISTLRSFGNEMLDQSELPISMAKFEIHMSQPARLHNLYKYTMSKKYAISGNINRDNKFLPEHTFAEGSCITLADIIIFVCIHILFNLIPLTSDKILELLPLTMTWYKKMIENDAIIKCLTCLPLQEIDCDNVINYVLPAVDNQSLYKSDSKRYRPRSRIYTRQEDIEHSLELVENLNVNTKLNDLPFGAEICIDWSSIPFDATPEGGSLPVARQKRKLDQLENLCRPVIKLAKKGDVIVDFCSGSGHLGITLAYLLPECSVILLENKEESLNRAKERVKKLKLTNVKFCQCNLFYFKGHFDIGTSLHACGVATDLVIQHCIRKNATFVCCPCCYGSVQSCQRVVYPRSNVFQKDIAIRDYLVLGHAADQTHDAGNSKTLQGKKCMTIIDTDRKLHAEQFGYNVQLAKLVPEDCTPKNHLLVGIPENGVCKC